MKTQVDYISTYLLTEFIFSSMNSLVSINIFQGKINRGIKKVVVAQSDKMKNKDIRIPKKI